MKSIAALRLRLAAVALLAGALAGAAAQERGSPKPQPAGAPSATEPVVDTKDLPRVPPTEPDKVLVTFKIKSGFHIELVAAEPLVVDPVAMAFDEDGRLFVVEMRDYSERREEKLGRIRLLEDTDGDGRFDKSTIFAEGLAWPTAVICWNGGVFVGATPDIMYLKDTNGDGVADERRVVFTGFGSGVARLNVQALFNSFTWGLDNRIHGASGGNGGRITRVNATNAPLELRGRDFSFDPRTLELRAESGGGQYGLCFDNYGHKFVCSNSRHIIAVMYEDRYAARNPFHAMPPAAVDIAVDGPAAEVYRISPDEPWRVIRTQWRVSGTVPGLIEGGGRPSGYFTAATGLTIYRGHAFPGEFDGDAFVADCGSNLIHRKKMRPDGVGFRAERPADEQRVEFLASTDNWFRPVQLANGPDGALYVADMYREVIEHPWSLPEPLKKHLDLNSGNDRGRIYRIVPDNFKQPKPPRLGRASTAGLVKTLEHPNGWHRDTAARLLYERQDEEAVGALTALAITDGRNKSGPARSPACRIHALHALAGLKKLEEGQIALALSSRSSEVRERALLLAEPFLALPDVRIWQKMREWAASPVTNLPITRADLYLAFAFGQLTNKVGFESFCHLADRVLGVGTYPKDISPQYIGNRFTIGYTNLPYRKEELGWLLPAMLSTVAEDALALFDKFATQEIGVTLTQIQRPNEYPHFQIGRNVIGEQELIHGLSRIIGIRNRPDEIQHTLARLRDPPPPRGMWGDLLARGENQLTTWEAIGGLSDGLQQSGSALQKHASAAELKPLFTQAADRVEQRLDTPPKWLIARNPLEQRLAAIKVLAYAPYEEFKGNLLSRIVISAAEPPQIQQAALAALSRIDHPDVGPDLLERWEALSPSLRVEAMDALLKRGDRIRALLDAMEKGLVKPSAINASQRSFLLSHRIVAFRQRAEKVLGRAPVASRQSVVDGFLPALKLDGAAANGAKTFDARCATCHRLGDKGRAVGPDLVTVKAGGKEKILTNILDPNREVAPAYLSYLLETRDGETLAGIIASETAASVTLRQANAVETVVLRSNISRTQSQGLSAMPEGLEAGLSQQDMADLLEFIVATEQKK